VCVEFTEKRQLPGFRSSGGAELALGRGKRRLQEKKLHKYCISEDQDLGICDMLSPIQERKWKSWFILFH